MKTHVIETPASAPTPAPYPRLYRSKGGSLALATGPSTGTVIHAGDCHGFGQTFTGSQCWEANGWVRVTEAVIVKFEP